MSLSDGLKTWFDYELLVVAIVVALLVAGWGMNQITGYLESLPLTSPEFALALMAVSFGTIIFMIWLAGRYN